MGKKNKSSPMAEASRQEIERLQEIYSFRRKEEVAGFLENHPYLVPLLLEAYPQIERHFSGHPVVFLEVITDPEADDDRELYAFIGTRLPPEGALDKLDKFDKDWWLRALEKAKGNLCIHVKYL